MYPALAVADALVDRGIPKTRIMFMGGQRIEAEAVPHAGYGFVEFDLAKLRRQVSLENLRIPIVVRRGMDGSDLVLIRPL